MTPGDGDFEQEHAIAEPPASPAEPEAYDADIAPSNALIAHRLQPGHVEGRTVGAQRPLASTAPPGQVQRQELTEANQAAIQADVEQTGSGTLPATPPATTSRALAQADAVSTNTRIFEALQAMAADKDNPTVYNTAELFLGPSPRLHYTPMTPRSDSESIRIARDKPVGTVPFGTVVYFFTGTVEPPRDPTPDVIPLGTIEGRPEVGGTLEPPITVAIRGRNPDGSWKTEADLKHTLIHEASHLLVRAYGEHPHVADPKHFDRYKSEFRSYFVQQFGRFAGTENLDDRAHAIKKYLVGTGPTDTKSYAALRTAYWTPPPTNPFRTSVDQHKRPDGFNLTNSLRLDRLFTALNEAATVLSRVADVIVMIAGLSAAERTEAAASQMIKTHAAASGHDGEQRILAALSSPANELQLNPNGSERIQRFYETVARNDPDRICDAYDALSASERDELRFNPAAWSFIDHYVLDRMIHACVCAMVVDRSSTQYIAMKHFLGECFLTFIGAYGSPPTELPRDVRAAVKLLTPLARYSLFRESTDARLFFVDSLPAPVSEPLLKILAGDAEP